MRIHQTPAAQPKHSNKQNDPLTYEWSKGYVSTFNPKNGDQESLNDDKTMHH